MGGGHCGTGPESARSSRDGLPVIAITGQPNSGKSTLFNALAGYRAISANFPGTTVSFTRADVLVCGRRAHLVDLPGAYSLSPSDPAEKVARDYLLGGQVDAVLLVLDASTLARGIGLALEMIELGLPLVVVHVVAGYPSNGIAERRYFYIPRGIFVSLPGNDSPR